MTNAISNLNTNANINANANANVNAIKQPQPNIQNNQNSNTQAKGFNLPKVGAVNVPNISKTPLSDTISLKKEENPQTAYKLTKEKQPGFKLQSFSSIGIIACGLISLISLFKKKKPPVQ